MCSIGSDQALKEIADKFAGPTLCWVARRNRDIRDVYRSLVSSGYLKISGVRYVATFGGAGG